MSRRYRLLKNLALVMLLALLAFLIMGYHPGLEDDAFYLAAIKRDLNPTLFPHDADFFRIQFQATIFDKLIAFSARATHLPIAWTALLWQFATIFLLLHGCRRIAHRCFTHKAAQWSAVGLIAALLTIPIPGIGINLVDQYLHPRTLATAAIIAAIVAVIDRRPRVAAMLLVLALSIHAIMASFGISFCLILYWCLRDTTREHEPIPVSVTMLLPVGLLLPLGWIFEPASDAWRQAAGTRSFYFLGRWHWYEWFGVFAPMALLYGLQWFTQRHAARAQANRTGPEELDDADANLRALVMSLLYFSALQTVVGLAIMLPPGLERLRPFEPMRYLHLLYLLFFLIAGGLLGRHLLQRRVYLWLALFIPLSAGMFYAQRQMFPATEHIEWPGASSLNSWLQAFAWIRAKTPADSLFAVDPHYMESSGEDFHGFRALAERSVLADYDKDGGMAARVPSLAPRWLKEVNAQTGWQNFQDTDFKRLKKDFGVTWVIVEKSATSHQSAMNCPYENHRVSVCRLN
ncbi:MAG TPA: DUF6798 domain-containing protein [Candidatus Solibacter sp.]|nr:DUF6798 domain-containing protein [Candidatus Solibacter sp.]